MVQGCAGALVSAELQPPDDLEQREEIIRVKSGRSVDLVVSDEDTVVSRGHGFKASLQQVLHEILRFLRSLCNSW